MSQKFCRRCRVFIVAGWRAALTFPRRVAQSIDIVQPGGSYSEKFVHYNTITTTTRKPPSPSILSPGLYLLFFQAVTTSEAWGDLEPHDRQTIVRQALSCRAGNTVRKYAQEYRKYVSFLAKAKRPIKLPSDHLDIAAYLARVSQSK